MNSFQRICRSPAFLVLALILCAAVIAGGVALAPAAPKVWIVIPVLLAVAAALLFYLPRNQSGALTVVIDVSGALHQQGRAAKKERGGKRGCGKSRP